MLAISHDGSSLYAGAVEDGLMNAGGLATFARDRSDGGLTQPAGAAGCVKNDVIDAEGCGTASSIEPEALALDPRSDNLYVSGRGTRNGMPTFGFHVLSRGAGGTLEAPAAPHACVSEITNFLCSSAPGPFRPEAVLVSGDGRDLYAVGGHAVQAFHRNLLPTCTGRSVSTAAGERVTVSLTCADANATTRSRARSSLGRRTARSARSTPRPEL